MPRKRWLTRLSEYKVPTIDPSDRNANEDRDLVQFALVDFDELAVLSSQIRAPTRRGPSGSNSVRSHRRRCR